MKNKKIKHSELVKLQFGERVRVLRELKDVPAYIAAMQTGVNPSVWTAMERYGIPPQKRKTRERIAEYLGVPYGVLYADYDETK